MAITKKPAKAAEKNDQAVDHFIGGAPDSGKEQKTPRRVRKGKKVQITLTLTEQLLEQVDAMAEEYSQSRAGMINLALTQMMKRGLVVDSGGDS